MLVMITLDFYFYLVIFLISMNCLFYFYFFIRILSDISCVFFLILYKTFDHNFNKC